MRLLYETGGWLEPSWTDSLLERIVRCSFAFVVAEDPSGAWVGMGRLISDGVSDAYLQDVVVRKEWQDLGIGTRIVKELLIICREHGIDWVGTIAGPEREFFYRRFGFARMGGYTPMRYER